MDAVCALDCVSRSRPEDNVGRAAISRKVRVATNTRIVRRKCTTRFPDHIGDHRSLKTVPPEPTSASLRESATTEKPVTPGLAEISI